MESQNLIENFKQFILSKYQENDGKESDVKVLFEAIGHPISEYDVSEEVFSSLVNVYPNSDEDIFIKHTQKFDRLYQNILNSCKLKNHIEDSSFTKMKFKALGLLEKYTVAGDSIIADTYLKTSASPINWFSDDSYWLKYDPAIIENNLAFKMTEQASLEDIKNVSDRINMSRKMDVLNVNPTTRDTDISLEYCLVDIDRRWFDSSLFDYYTNWYVPNKRKGEFAISPFDFQYMPTAMIVVRKLNMKANWSEKDAQQIPNSNSIGPFSLKGSEWVPEKGLLHNEQTQIIGWVCSKTPSLPPQSDPNLHPGGYVKLENQAWNQVKFKVSWKELDEEGKIVDKNWGSGIKRWGYTYKLDIPVDATNIKIICLVNTGQVFNNWNQLMSISEFETPNKTYKVTGSAILGNQYEVINS